MKKNIYILLIALSTSPLPSYAGLFSMNNQPSSPPQNQGEMTEQINVFFNADKQMQKRKDEAYKLIEEGKKLIKKGEKSKNQQLTTKGYIKKEIGEKQVQLLRQQLKERQNESNSWQ